MPQIDGLASVEEPRWLALPNGVGARASQGTDLERIREVAAIQVRALGGGQTRKVLACQEELFRTLRPPLHAPLP